MILFALLFVYWRIINMTTASKGGSLVIFKIIIIKLEITEGILL